jgi:hypothetical protein
MSPNDPYHEEPVEDDGPYDADDSLWAMPYSAPGAWWPWYSDADADDGVAEPGYDGTSEDGGSWWDESLITLLLVVGVVLFVFPEPATSGLGILLITAGVIAWLIDLLT